MRQKRLPLVILSCLFISPFVKAQTDRTPHVINIVRGSNIEITTTCYSYEAVPIMNNPHHQFSDGCYNSNHAIRTGRKPEFQTEFQVLSHCSEPSASRMAHSFNQASS